MGVFGRFFNFGKAAGEERAALAAKMNGLEAKITEIGEEKRASNVDYGNFSKWFVPYNIFAKRSGSTLANNEIIFACITELANSMASLPLKLYRDLVPQTQHRLNYMLSVEPNANMTALSFIQMMEVLRNVYGND